MSQLIDWLNWRYATKSMNPNKQLAADKLQQILEAVRLTASSEGLQPYSILVVTNQDIKQQIFKAAFEQTVITDCSHLLVFAVWDNYTAKRIDNMFDLTNRQRGSTNPGWEAKRDSLKNRFTQATAAENFEHATKQAYIGLGTALVAAAAQQVDSTPIEGFIPAKVDEILKLDKQGLKSVLMLPLGYRNSDDDWLVDLKKIRRHSEDFIINID